MGAYPAFHHLRQPRLLPVAQDPGDPGQDGQFCRGSLGVTAGDPRWGLPEFTGRRRMVWRACWSARAVTVQVFTRIRSRAGLGGPGRKARVRQDLGYPRRLVLIDFAPEGDHLKIWHNFTGRAVSGSGEEGAHEWGLLSLSLYFFLLESRLDPGAAQEAVAGIYGHGLTGGHRRLGTGKDYSHPVAGLTP